MNSSVRFYIYIVILCFALIAALSVRKVDRSFLFLKILLAITLLSEIAAHISSMVYRNNMLVYLVYTPLMLICIGWYYHYSSPVMKKYGVGIILSLLSIPIALSNTIFLQPVDTFCSNYVLFAGCCISGMALLTFYQLYIGDWETDLVANPHFRISLVFLIYWSATFLSYAFHETMSVAMFHLAYQFIWAINLLVYASLGLVFISMNRKIKRDAK